MSSWVAAGNDDVAKPCRSVTASRYLRTSGVSSDKVQDRLLSCQRMIRI